MDRIQLHIRASFQTAAVLYGTWAHEQIQSKGLQSLLKRELGGVFGKPCCVREQMVAEQGTVLHSG
ncbi:zincin-like metallopeptidase domain-containing protein [Cyanobium sp. Copco_Reservoir_LC18]|uniref:zincin-like metallopeptidase domain-containing protein n=1 Tax=Cyanobium sp. Copco_Reservoir_LC18 TaxID=1328305 RepID=UPI00135B5BCF